MNRPSLGALALVIALATAACTQTKEVLEKANDAMTRGAERLSRAVGASPASPPDDAAPATDAIAPGSTAGAAPSRAIAADALPAKEPETRKGQTVLASLKPGPYEPSKFAIGADIEAMHYRAESPGDGLVNAPALTTYLNDLLAKVKQATGITGIPGRVYLRPQSSYVGLATPDGNIFLSLNQVRDIQCDDQLVALLAHELGHVVLKHHDSDSVRSLTQQIPGAQSLIERGLTSAPGMLPGAGFLPRGLPGSPVPLPVAPPGGQNPFAAARSLGIEISVLDDFVFPAWSRGQETAADRFALDVAKRMGYSFAIGMKEWLEQVEDVEEQQKKTGNPGAAPARQGRPANQIAGVNVNAWADERLKNARRTHASNRVESLFDYFELHYADEDRPVQKCGRWPALKETREARQLFEVYDLAFEIEALLRSRSRAGVREGLGKDDRATLAALASKLEKHPFRLDAHPMILNRLYRAHVLTDSKGAAGVLARTLGSPEPAWVTYRTMAVASLYNPATRAEAAKVLLTGYRKLQEPPRVLPDLIQHLVRAGDRDEANRLHTQCLSKLPELRDFCNRAQRGALR